jgi:hypothetical protein
MNLLLPQPSKIAIKAREWLGTPFKHQGRLKGVGVDCLGLLIGVAGELNIQTRGGFPLHRLDETSYGRLPDGDHLKNVLASHLHKIESPVLSPAYKANPPLTPPFNLIWGRGTIALIRFDGNPQHLAIVSELADGSPGLIHAYSDAGKVVENSFSGKWLDNLDEVYLVP